jgi:SWI/SNF-related matrix-associated actin-dependent regulator of chromatin subfamily A-like protein 1
MLFPFQEEGIRFALEHEGTLLADEPGLGKTIQAIGVINQDPTLHRIIIVCSASMRIPWRRELQRWLSRPLSIAVVGVDVGFVQTLFRKEILIINYDWLSKVTKKALRLNGFDRIRGASSRS